MHYCSTAHDVVLSTDSSLANHFPLESSVIASVAGAWTCLSGLLTSFPLESTVITLVASTQTFTIAVAPFWSTATSVTAIRMGGLSRCPFGIAAWLLTTALRVFPVATSEIFSTPSPVDQILQVSLSYATNPWRTLVCVASRPSGMETTVYPRSGSDRDSAVTAPALAVPLAPADAPPVAADEDVEPLPALALFIVGMVPPSFGLLDEHPTRARAGQHTRTQRTHHTTATRQTGQGKNHQAAPPQSRRAQPPGTARTPPTLPTGSQQSHGPNEPHPSFCRSPHSRE